MRITASLQKVSQTLRFIDKNHIDMQRNERSTGRGGRTQLTFTANCDLFFYTRMIKSVYFARLS